MACRKWSGEGDSRRAYWIVGGTAGAIHLLLLLCDAFGGEGFFRADRAQQRFGNMQALLDSVSSGTFIHMLARLGNIGDYGVHAALFGLAGHLGVTVFQTLLAIPAACCVVYISLQCFGSARVAAASGLLYTLLPQSLAFPHQLLSEALSNPLLIFGTAAFVSATGAARPAYVWIASGLLFGLAGIVRPALMPLPLVAAALLLLVGRREVLLRRLSMFLAAGFAPFVLWGLFMLSQTGQFGFGESHQDLGINFSQSTAKVLQGEGLAPPDGRAPEGLPERLTLSEYLGYLKKYPGGFANLYFKNTVVMISDSGIGRLYVDLLGFGAEARLKLQDPVIGWRAQLTHNGPIAMLRHGIAVAPGTIIAGVAGAVGFAFINLGVLTAYILFLGRNSALWNSAEALQRRWTLAFLLVIPLYVLATSQVVAYAPSRLRSQGEFAWAILAVVGWTTLLRWWSGRGSRRFVGSESRGTVS